MRAHARGQRITRSATGGGEAAKALQGCRLRESVARQRTRPRVLRLATRWRHILRVLSCMNRKLSVASKKIPLPKESDWPFLNSRSSLSNHFPGFYFERPLPSQKFADVGIIIFLTIIFDTFPYYFWNLCNVNTHHVFRSEALCTVFTFAIQALCQVFFFRLTVSLH